jgi:hypothetical protein
LVNEELMLDELKKIRELLAAKPAPPPPAPKGLWNEFKSFIESYKVMGLAVAFILGLYLGQASAITSNKFDNAYNWLSVTWYG